MKIHKMHTTSRIEHQLDPSSGTIKAVPVAMYSQADDDRIVWPGGLGEEPRTFELQPDGTFDLPAEVAAHFLRQPGWHEGANPFFEEPTPSVSASHSSPKSRTRAR